jgi:hypothetical protein
MCVKMSRKALVVVTAKQEWVMMSADYWGLVGGGGRSNGAGGVVD